MSKDTSNPRNPRNILEKEKLINFRSDCFKTVIRGEKEGEGRIDTYRGTYPFFTLSLFRMFP